MEPIGPRWKMEKFCCPGIRQGEVIGAMMSTATRIKLWSGTALSSQDSVLPLKAWTSIMGSGGAQAKPSLLVDEGSPAQVVVIKVD